MTIANDKGTILFNQITAMLPNEPRSYDTSDDPGFWTDGSIILCPSEYDCECLACFLEDAFREISNCSINTGYFDPFEDAKSGEQDDFTGFWYIEIL